MEWSTGTVLFYGGIAGCIASVLLGVILSVVLHRRKKRIEAEILQQYL